MVSPDGEGEHSRPHPHIQQDPTFKYKAGALLLGVAGASMVGGFGLTLAQARKRDPDMFNKGLVGAQDLHQAGGALAMRALARGSLYALTGFSLFCWGVWRVMGVSNVSTVHGQTPVPRVNTCALTLLLDLVEATHYFYIILLQLQEFRMKAGELLPRIPRNEPPQSRTEFSGLNDLLQYLIDEDHRKKNSDPPPK